METIQEDNEKKEYSPQDFKNSFKKLLFILENIATGKGRDTTLVKEKFNEILEEIKKKTLQPLSSLVSPKDFYRFFYEDWTYSQIIDSLYNNGPEEMNQSSLNKIKSTFSSDFIKNFVKGVEKLEEIFDFDKWEENSIIIDIAIEELKEITEKYFFLKEKISIILDNLKEKIESLDYSNISNIKERAKQIIGSLSLDRESKKTIIDFIDEIDNNCDLGVFKKEIEKKIKKVEDINPYNFILKFT